MSRLPYTPDILMLHRRADVDDNALIDTLGAHLPPGEIAEPHGLLAEQCGRPRDGVP